MIELAGNGALLGAKTPILEIIRRLGERYSNLLSLNLGTELEDSTERRGKCTWRANKQSEVTSRAVVRGRSEEITALNSKTARMSRGRTRAALTILMLFGYYRRRQCGRVSSGPAQSQTGLRTSVASLKMQEVGRTVILHHAFTAIHGFTDLGTDIQLKRLPLRGIDQHGRKWKMTHDTH